VSNLLNQIIRAWLLILWPSFVVCGAANAATAPGTVIYNSANIFYEGLDTGFKSQVQSNVASISVAQLFRFTLKNEYNLLVDAGDVVYFPHRIKNTGNTADSYQLSYSTVGVNTLTDVLQDAPANTRDDFYEPAIFYLDINGNGVVDANDSVVEQTITLLPDQHQDIIVSSRVSESLNQGDHQNFIFAVKSAYLKDVKTLRNEVTVGRSGEIEIGLRTFPQCESAVFSGGAITHEIQAGNSGSRPINALNYNVDGRVENGIILEIPVTEHTSFTRFGDAELGSVAGKKVVKLDGFNENQWTSVLDDTTSSEKITHVGYLVDPNRIINDDTVGFTVHLQVNYAIPGYKTVSTAAFLDTNLDRIPDIVSESTCNKVSSVAGANKGGIRFIETAAHIAQSGQVPDLFTDNDFVGAQYYTVKHEENDSYVSFRDGLFLELSIDELSHSNVRVDLAGNHFVVVTLVSDITGDSVDIVLLETDTQGVFRSVAPIVLNTYQRSDGGVCPILESMAQLVPIYEKQNPGCVLLVGDNDRLNAFYGEPETGFSVSAEAFVRSQSIVFDSKTMLPVTPVII